MMSEHDDGGRAFPNDSDNTKEYPIFDGMTLLDYFAGQALQGALASSPDGCASFPFLADERRDPGPDPTDIVTEYCYSIVASMIVQKRRREAQPERT